MTRLAVFPSPPRCSDEPGHGLGLDVALLTPIRRAKSVRSYMRWLGQATGTIVVEGQRIYSREGWGERAKS